MFIFNRIKYENYITSKLYASSRLARYINQSGNQLLLCPVALTPWLHGDQMVPSRQFVDGIIAGYCNIISAYIFVDITVISNGLYTGDLINHHIQIYWLININFYSGWWNLYFKYQIPLNSIKWHYNNTQIYSYRYFYVSQSYNYAIIRRSLSLIDVGEIGLQMLKI